MSVDSRNRWSAHYLEKVQKVRKFATNEVEDYVRKLPGMDKEDYTLLKAERYFLPAAARTIEAYTGMIMMPEPSVENAPDGMDPYFDDLTFDGEPLSRVTGRVVEEVVTSGRCCVVVDYPATPEGQNMSVAEAERAGLRAYARFYRFEDILDWRVETRGGQRYIAMLKLQEFEEVLTSEWETQTKRRIRVLDFNEEGQYRVRVFREEEGWAQFGEDLIPQIRNQPLEEIQAVVFNANSLDVAQVGPPPLEELVDANENHLNLSARHNWALMWCASPMYWIADDTLKNDGASRPRIGSSSLAILGTGGTMGVVSVGADGHGALSSEKEAVRKDMAAIGARILVEDAGGAISTETERIRRAGEHSVLASLASTVGDGMTRVARYLAAWGGMNGENIKVRLNTDFLPVGLQAGELTEWTGALQQGSIPLSVFLNRLKSRGVVDPTMSEDEYRDELERDEEDLMPAPAVPVPSQPPEDEDTGDDADGE